MLLNEIFYLGQSVLHLEQVDEYCIDLLVLLFMTGKASDDACYEKFMYTCVMYSDKGEVFSYG